MHNTNQFYRLAEARELRGLSVAELAEKLEISRQAVYKYESGMQRPGPEVIERIIATLGFPYSFFAKPRKGSDLSDRPIFFRDMKTNQEATRKMARRWLQILCDQIHDLEEHYVDFAPVNLPSLDLPTFRELQMSDVEVAAEQLRRFWNLGDGPISNVTQLLENNGFVIFRKKLPAEKMDACSLVKDGRPCILINTYKQTCSRDIMNLAHELGHVILHQDISSADIDNKEDFDLIESQAWRFAQTFLMPPAVFSVEVGYPTLQHFVTLKHRWRVSIAAMIMHCAELGIIDAARKQYLFREMSRNKMRAIEPLDEILPIEKSNVLLECEQLIVAEGLETRERLFESTGLGKEDYCELIGAPEGYLNPPNTRPRLRLL